MTSPDARNIWYDLVDSTTGQPYRNTNAAKVTLGPAADVADFRDAVYRKNSAILPGLVSSQLLIYANRVAFDKRNSAEEKVEPLKSSANLHALGTSEEEALIVVVPSPKLAALDGNIHLCEIPFYKDIFIASECDDWLYLKEVIPSIRLKKLYIRESYKSIVSSIMHNAASPIVNDGFVKVILTGTPGIGKSLFMIYLLYKLVKEGNKRVLLIYHPFNIYYDGQGGVFELPDIPSPYMHSFWKTDLWCLFDAKNKLDADLNRLPYDYCHFVLSTSPRRDLVNDFKKPPVPQYFYMPTWTETELEAIAPLFPQSTAWRGRFEILGGIPRIVFEGLNHKPQVILDMACAQYSLENYIKIVNPDSMITDHSKVIHSLVHITSTNPFIECSVCYASQKAIEVIAQKLEKEANLQLLQLLSSYKGSPLIAALCGYIFESYALKMLEEGGTFTYRSLATKKGVKASESTEERTLEIPSSTRKRVDRVEENQTHKLLHVPISKRYPAIDAWIPGIGGFQITVGKTHTLNDNVKNQLELLGEGANKLYWLLHPNNYGDLSCSKSVEGIEQYAVLIPVKNATVP